MFEKNYKKNIWKYIYAPIPKELTAATHVMQSSTNE